MDEWDIVHGDYHEHEAEPPEFVGMVGKNITIMAGEKPQRPPGDPVDAIRAKLTEQIRDIVFSDQTGAWLLRHAPGVGKTHTFAMVADEYESLGQPVIMCAPTIAEAERMAEAAGCGILRAQSEKNCQQLAIEGANGPLRNHHRGRHRGSDFCRTCPFKNECLNTEGQYRYDQKAFHMRLAGGTVYCAITVAMLEYVAQAIVDSGHRDVVWTDEDLMPHVAKNHPPVSRSEILEWIEHAKKVGCNITDMQFMKAIDSLLSDNPEGDSPETPDDHHTGAGCRARSIPAAALVDLRDMAKLVLGGLGKSATHNTEKTREDGEPLPVGSWRPATIRICAEMVLGACWLHIDAQDYRSLIGRSINRAILELPKTCAVLQSDATASPELWRRVWGSTWRGYMDCNPQRAASINWVVGSVGKTGKSSEKTMTAIVNRLAHWGKQNPGEKAGLITYKAWIPAIKKALRGKGCKVYEIDGDGDPNKADILLGWYGRHDRGVNAYHEARVAELFIVGPFRLPMSEYHQKTKALIEMGAEIPLTQKSNKARCGPVADSGEYIIQQANRATVSEHPQTCWVADHERAASLTQAMERIRSVDRAAKGIKPAIVHLWGIDATIPHIPLPLKYSY